MTAADELNEHVSAHPERRELVFLDPAEAELIRGLRTDPLQHEHLAFVDGEQVTVQHPVMERVRLTLAGCPMLDDAQLALIEQEAPDGTYRYDPAQKAWMKLEDFS